MNLYQRLLQVKTTNPYFTKDLEKASKANKFIGQGSLASSTNKYAIAAGDLANVGQYVKDDVIFVSVEGNRKNRMALDQDEILKAIEVGASFVSDNKYNRNRPYNIGERELEELLLSHGYTDNNGFWTKK